MKTMKIVALSPFIIFIILTLLSSGSSEWFNNYLVIDHNNYDSHVLIKCLYHVCGWIKCCCQYHRSFINWFWDSYVVISLTLCETIKARKQDTAYFISCVSCIRRHQVLLASLQAMIVVSTSWTSEELKYTPTRPNSWVLRNHLCTIIHNAEHASTG